MKNVFRFESLDITNRIAVKLGIYNTQMNESDPKINNVMVKIVKQLGLFTTILLDQYYTNLENDQRNQRETNCKDIHI